VSGEAGGTGGARGTAGGPGPTTWVSHRRTPDDMNVTPTRLGPRHSGRNRPDRPGRANVFSHGTGQGWFSLRWPGELLTAADVRGSLSRVNHNRFHFHRRGHGALRDAQRARALRAIRQDRSWADQVHELLAAQPGRVGIHHPAIHPPAGLAHRDARRHRRGVPDHHRPARPGPAAPGLSRPQGVPGRRPPRAGGGTARSVPTGAVFTPDQPTHSVPNTAASNNSPES
jgi:hypothetical protein